VLAKNIAPGLKIYGKGLDAIWNPYGEINTDIVTAGFAKVLGKTLPGDEKAAQRDKLKGMVIPRSSTLCAGCSHLGAYSALREALKKFQGVHVVNGDIGCYEQGGYGVFSEDLAANGETSKKYRPDSPYNILDTIYVMGSGISMAHGQAQAGYAGKGKLVAVAGDSTFIHATLPAVVNSVYNRADITFIIMDNYWTCMTGHQPNPNTLAGPQGQELEGFDLKKMCEALGVKHVSAVGAYDRKACTEALIAALAYEGPSVVILYGECQLQLQRRLKRGPGKTHVEQDACIGCKQCVQTGCPAVMFDVGAKKAATDEILCVDCGLCAQVCPVNAIKSE
jgi:indolepyruvate ferredoxin oxidoreductase alpha subunit